MIHRPTKSWCKYYTAYPMHSRLQEWTSRNYHVSIGYFRQYQLPEHFTGRGWNSSSPGKGGDIRFDPWLYNSNNTFAAQQLDLRCSGLMKIVETCIINLHVPFPCQSSTWAQYPMCLAAWCPWFFAASQHQPSHTSSVFLNEADFHKAIQRFQRIRQEGKKHLQLEDEYQWEFLYLIND